MFNSPTYIIKESDYKFICEYGDMLLLNIVFTSLEAIFFHVKEYLQDSFLQNILKKNISTIDVLIFNSSLQKKYFLLGDLMNMPS